MTLIHLSERARELFFGQLVGKTLQSAKDKRGNTYSSGTLSSGNTSAPGRECTFGTSVSKDFISQISPLFSSQSVGFMNPLPTPYSLLTSECYAQELIDELNGGQQS